MQAHPRHRNSEPRQVQVDAALRSNRDLHVPVVQLQGLVAAPMQLGPLSDEQISPLLLRLVRVLLVLGLDALRCGLGCSQSLVCVRDDLGTATCWRRCATAG